MSAISGKLFLALNIYSNIGDERSFRYDEYQMLFVVLF